MTTPSELARARWLGRRTLLEIGPVRLPSYSTLLYVGIVVGIYVGAAVAAAEGLSATTFALTSVLLLVPALVGARLWYVAQHLDRYRAEPRAIWARSQGGSAVYGGLVLSVLASVPLLPLVGLPFLAYWDAAILTMLVGLAVTRLGCLMHGCCAGRETGSVLGMWLPGRDGEWRRRYPTPLLESGWALVVLVVALAARPSLPFDGARFAAVVGSYAAGRAVLELTRATDDPGRTVRVNVAFSGVLLVMAVVVLIVGARS